MKHTQTQGDTQAGLASLLDGTTPGPWTVTEMGLAPRHMIGARVNRIAVTYNDCCSTSEDRANARLIAAAPALAASHAALVAALEDILTHRHPLQESYYDAVYNQARKALSDARKVQGMEGGTR